MSERRPEGASEDVSHLPHHGGASEPGPPSELPHQRRGITPQMRGRYPDYDVLEQVEHWDERTREVVLDRVAQRALDPRSSTTSRRVRLRAFCDVVTGQDCEPRIPVLEMVDEKLSAAATRRLSLRGHAARPRDLAGGRGRPRRLRPRGGPRLLRQAPPSECQHEIVERFSKGELDWELPVKKAWAVVMRMVLAAFYSHPWAWSEIGFGGPAYPRGFARLGAGQREQWESPPEFAIDPVEDVPARGLE